MNHENAISNSGVRRVFTPYTPVDVVEHFCGREEQVSRLVSVINSPGQHALLYGDRGVGKTSLATIACRLISRLGVTRGKFFSKRCDSKDTFASIVHEPLRYIGIDYEVTEETRDHTRGGEGKLKIPIVEAGLASKRTRTVRRVPRHRVDSPSWVAKRLSKLKGLFLIDEADALKESNERESLAQLIKFLSDYKSAFKLIVVGIATTGEELTAGHPSIERCLKEIHLARMADSELREIAEKGMEQLKLSCSEKVVESIVDISAGYPHFTHLICLKCAVNAIVAGNRHILPEDLAVALHDAVGEAEGALRRRYENTIRGAKNEAEYISILRAAADCPIPEFRLARLQEELTNRLGLTIPRAVLSRYLTAMLSNGQRGVFVRVGKGVYRFSDPRMPSLIKMVGTQRAIRGS
ncbi:MAG: ATP-binding protein [bacterium]|nr:ATP-binding protein [bacterium]